MNRLRKYSNKILFSKISVTILFILALIASVYSATYLATSSESLSTEEADALYGGYSDDSSYPFAGYLIDYSSIFTSQVCGVTFLTPNTGITAAHCFDFEDGLYFAGSLDLETAPVANVPIVKYKIHEDWDFTTLQGDLALVSLESEAPNINSFAKISTPLMGCNYEILAYGSTNESVLSNKDLRRKAKVCIDHISEDRIYISSPDGGVCFGDSGSPIFEKDTNNLVAVMSAITSDNDAYSKENCFVNNTAVAMRVDSNMEFITSSQADVLSKVGCPVDTDILCAEGESCRSNRCNTPDSYVYIKALDQRSGSYLFDELLFPVSVGVFIVITMYTIVRIVKKSKSNY